MGPGYGWTRFWLPARVQSNHENCSYMDTRDPAMSIAETAGLNYLRGLADCYREIERPPVEPRDWSWRAERTLGHLMTAPEARQEYEGDLYLLPYPAGQYPDSMVQIAIAMALREYAQARGRDIPIEGQLLKGMHRFYDPVVGTLRRYLPNFGEEKDYDAVDSWYLYHPMVNLARLALQRDSAAHELLMRSLD
jgi:hypothetical protein